MAKKYLISLYIKFFFFILIGLILFFVGLDFLSSLKSLPQTANLKILYTLYRGMYAIDILTPITIVLAMIMTKLYLIRSNELVAFYALGYSKKDILKPIFFTSLFLTIIYLFLHLTSFAYAQEYAKNIKEKHMIGTVTKNLFFKFHNKYVYFDKLYPLKRSAYGIKIYDIVDKELKDIVIAKEAIFMKNFWHIANATVVKNRGQSISIEKKDIDTLYGYKPKILDMVYEGKTNISLTDAFYVFRLFKDQNIPLNKIKSVIYYQLFFPFFAPLLMVIIFYFVPISTRVSNLNLFTFFATIFSLIFWGILYTLAKLSFTGTLSPEIAIVLPISLLFFVSLFFYKKF